MLLRTTTVFLCSALSLPLCAAIYKSVDENGNVVFSDTPASSEAEPVEIGPINTIPAQEVEPRPGAAAEEPTPEPVNFSLAFTQPQHDQAIRSNNGQITVALTVEPALTAEGGNQLVIVMDGAEVSRGRDTSAVLNNVSRGTHTLAARIETEAGEVRASASDIQFHVLRTSILNQ